MNVALNTGRLALYFTENTYASLTAHFVTLKAVVNTPQDLFIATQNFDLTIVEDCTQATLTVDSPAQPLTFIVGQTAPADSFLTTTFTSSDASCEVKYEAYLFNGDANSNGVQDPSEFSLLPTSNVAAGGVFFKTLDTDLVFEINQNKPVGNLEALLYTLKARAYFTCTGCTNEATDTFTVDV